MIFEAERNKPPNTMVRSGRKPLKRKDWEKRVLEYPSFYYGSANQKYTDEYQHVEGERARAIVKNDVRKMKGKAKPTKGGGNRKR